MGITAHQDPIQVQKNEGGVQFYMCMCTYGQIKGSEKMAHIGFLHSLKWLQPNKPYEMTSEQLWTLLRKSGIRLKASQSCHQNAKKFKNPQIYKDYVNSQIGKAIQDTRNRYQISQSLKEEQNPFQIREDSPQTCFRKKKQHFYGNLPTILKEIDEQTNCSICLEVFVLPVLTACGHAFCYQCIDQHLNFQQTCPNCRESIKEVKFKIDRTLDRIVRTLFSHESDRDRAAAYQQRLDKAMEWRQSREVTPDSLQVGAIVDIRDTELIWCQADILDVYYRHNEVEAVLVHYHHWHRTYDEVIYIPSSRIAPLGFFTKRQDVSSYRLKYPQDNLRGEILSAESRAAAAAGPDPHGDQDQSQNSINSFQNEQEQENMPFYRVYLRRVNARWNAFPIPQPHVYFYSYPYALRTIPTHHNVNEDQQNTAHTHDMNEMTVIEPAEEEDSSMEEEEPDPNVEY